MKNTPQKYELKTKNTIISARQLAFFIAFFLPIGKLLELPSLLTSYAGGDLLIAALVGLIFEGLSLTCLLLFCKQTKSSPFSFLEERFGAPTANVARLVYATFLLLFSTLPLFDLEKFSHAAFSDTSPTFFVFTPFFFLSGFLCVRGIQGIGRAADLAPVLFLIPIVGLLAMSLGQADFSRLLPVMEKPLSVSLNAFWKTLPYFSFGGLLLPLTSGYRYEQGDERKLLPAFAVGAVLTLLFLAVFFAVFGLLGAKEHFAVMKLAQFFPALKFVGRIDLLLVYALSICLFYFTAFPLQLCTQLFTDSLPLKSKLPTAVILSVSLYFVVLFGNKYSTRIHAVFTSYLPPVFLLFSVLFPVIFLLLSLKNGRGRYGSKANGQSKSQRGNS